MGDARPSLVAWFAIAIVAAFTGCSTPPQPAPATGPPTIRFEVLPGGAQPTTVLVAGPTVTSSFGLTSLGYAQDQKPTLLPYESPQLAVSNHARYQMNVSMVRSSPSALEPFTYIICRVLLRDTVIDERIGHSCDVNGRL